MPEFYATDAPSDAIVAELRALRALPTELRALPVSALDTSAQIDRRAAERLERLDRDQRRERRERGRERDQERPWTPGERWTLPKRLWRERRDHERSLIDTRDAAFEALEHALQARRPTYERWLDELQSLDPQQAEWCAEIRAALAAAPPYPPDIAALWRRRRDAALAAATRLREHPTIRATLAPNGTSATAALWRELVALVQRGALGAPLTPLLAAALIAGPGEMP